jgi:hypothetical protein
MDRLKVKQMARQADPSPRRAEFSRLIPAAGNAL